MCLVVIVAQVMLGGFFVGRLSSRGFRAGSLLAGGWGGVMVFVYLGLLFCGVWLGFVVFEVVNDGDGNV